MKKNFVLSLGQIWLLISIFSLTLPVFMPSSANPQTFLENVIGTVTVVMFILSFPSSLFGLPVLFFAQGVLSVEANSMAGMYLNLFLLFVLGLVQWFWIVPRVLRKESYLQMIELLEAKSAAPLAGGKIPDDLSFPDTEGKTPIERVFQEKDAD